MNGTDYQDVLASPSNNIMLQLTLLIEKNYHKSGDFL
uniref:Transcriptional regulator n=1 Tax=Heterorhabditis bacteriophora TaxID=37862 RepID=A0A1I7WY65_HETBA